MISKKQDKGNSMQKREGKSRKCQRKSAQLARTTLIRATIYENQNKDTVHERTVQRYQTINV